MNFKNISLFSLLFVAGFVGMALHAQDEFEVTMDLQKKLEFNRRELKATEELRMAYIGLMLEYRAIDGCHSEKDADSIESCYMAKQMFNEVDRLNTKQTKLNRIIESIENKISDTELPDAIEKEQE